MPYTVVDKGSKYFNTKLYTGTGATQSITGVGFKPDWVWLKNRSTTTAPVVYDAVRGATKDLYTSATDAEGTNVNGVTSFNSDGFSVGSSGGVNGNTQNIVAWNWLGANTTASNTSGTITSTVSANTTSGFSIVSWTGNGTNGATVGHGLGVVPKMFIIKERTDVNPWVVYHASVDVTGDFTLRLDETSAKANGNNTNNDTAPTSSLITLGTSSLTNGSSKTYVAYCFAEVKGYSKFGSYTGNGSTDGTFVYTGFKPAFTMVRATVTAGASWIIQDTVRNTYNPAPIRLFPNLSDAEGTSSAGDIDILSNGFKIRNTSGSWNTNSEPYIYMAFASNPFVSSRGIPTTAR